MRKSYLDALVALTEDYSIYDHFSVIERTTDQEVLKEYSNANKYDLVIYDGKDSKNLIKKLAKDEAFLYLSIEMFQKKEDTVNEYSVLYYVRNAELNNIQDLYSSDTKLSYKEQVKYAKDYALSEYNAVGYSLKLHKIKGRNLYKIPSSEKVQENLSEILHKNLRCGSDNINKKTIYLDKTKII
jgi:hypothetical protein